MRAIGNPIAGACAVMDEYKAPVCKCPGCGAPNDRASTSGELRGSGPFETRGPSGGDVTMCITCGFVCVFNDDLSLRKPSDEEMKTIEGDVRIAAMSKAWRAMKSERRGTN